VDSHPVLRPVSTTLQVITLGLVAAAAAYLGTHRGPDFVQNLLADALVPILVGLLVFGIAGFGLDRLGRTAVVLIAFDCIALVGPLFYAFLGFVGHDVRQFTLGLVIGGAPIFGAVGAAILDSDRPRSVTPPRH